MLSASWLNEAMTSEFACSIRQWPIISTSSRRQFVAVRPDASQRRPGGMHSHPAEWILRDHMSSCFLARPRLSLALATGNPREADVRSARRFVEHQCPRRRNLRPVTGRRTAPRPTNGGESKTKRRWWAHTARTSAGFSWTFVASNPLGVARLAQAGADQGQAGRCISRRFRSEEEGGGRMVKSGGSSSLVTPYIIPHVTKGAGTGTGTGTGIALFVAALLLTPATPIHPPTVQHAVNIPDSRIRASRSDPVEHRPARRACITAQDPRWQCSRRGPCWSSPFAAPPRAGIGYTAKPRRTGSVSDTLIGNRLPGSANDLSSARRDAVVKAAHSPFLQPGRRGSSCGNRAGIPVSCGENRLAQCLSSVSRLAKTRQRV
ncbi:hypothetical protein VFPFJ_02221 [Purpureocillium lilacinum]|uniref:Uncharacterized protein n=1 Tax=Purpureocillium lilacinum TaxID=33203 RepID=A0A179HUI9_PURLI|nr:hypothetical protein VFPFJ_02221 [Purpureocillium lilacinum]OAQ93060.1 hypothetical protein VFPFJ_02221 [Purpureocillium lilacinum]